MNISTFTIIERISYHQIVQSEQSFYLMVFFVRIRVQTRAYKLCDRKTIVKAISY